MRIQGLWVQRNRAILLDENRKLDPWPLDEGPKLKHGKSRLNLHGTILEGKSVGLTPPKKKQKTKNKKKP
jgi:hypothetical protein